MENPFISIIIITKNQRDFLEQILSAVSEQDEKRNEVIVVDSGSTDGALDIALRFGARIVNFHPEEGRPFHYPDAFNAGVSEARGQILVRLSGDAVPVSGRWLSSLVAPLESPSVAGAHSRQIYENSASAYHRLYCALANSRRYHALAKRMKFLTIFWGGSCAMKADLWRTVTLDRSVRIAEDFVWSHKIMGAGYELAFASESVVRHTHRKPLFREISAYCDFLDTLAIAWDLCRGKI